MNLIRRLIRRLFGGQRHRLLDRTLDRPKVNRTEIASLEAGEIPAEFLWLSADVDRHFHQWLVGVDAFVEQPLTASETGLLEAFEQLIQGEHGSTNLVPRLPTVVPQLMRSLKDETITGARLSRQIEKDPVLVGEAIRLANSPFYRRRRKIESIEQAVVLLGHNGLRQLIARVAFYPILNLQTGHVTKLVGPRLWSQSEKCALVCRCLARKERSDPFVAYLAGLVNNLGLLVGFRLMDRLLVARPDALPGSCEFYRRFIAQAGRLSHRIVEEWGFPEAVAVALDEKAANRFDDSLSLLGRILYVGDEYSKIQILLDVDRMPSEVDLAEMVGDPCYHELTAA
ncbi:HDOD domain-containing protein [Thiocystis violacea]|uniref:HDOD domain-containing protein n=1 Tax=Thiocystis violacea TaxID=13725 RepID=UPI001907EFF8|nr:HDOD domain-containing protein [Thiocystis violacea]